MEEADSLSLQKMKYRSLVKARRREMPEAELLAQSRAIFAKVAESSLYRKSRTVFVYMSMAGEVRTTEFIRKAWADGKKVAVPRTDMKKHRISFYYIESFDQVRPGVMGIMEPVTAEAARAREAGPQALAEAARAREAGPHALAEAAPGREAGRKAGPCACADEDESALVIMPGLAFDKDRHRIGYGGEFYDRYLQEHPNHPAAAAAFDFQIFDQLPSDVHDLRPDVIFTPDTVFTPAMTSGRT